jgi:2-polyprenyl-6-methoxyphenol hydroxylase-like FAD-dependent oxidoreductase
LTGSHFPVLIVRGGPCGLGLAIELGWRGVPCLLVEQSDETIAFPTANLINTRTMEFLRRWGIADTARYEGFPKEYPNTYLYLTGFNRHELARFEHPGNGDPAARSQWSPEGPIWCPKFFFDPVLRKRARSLPSVCLRFSCRLESFHQSAECVTADLVDLVTGRREQVAADYLVGCDGPSSDVRHTLGIKLQGRFAQDHQITIFFRSPLLSHCRHGPAVAYWIVRPGLRAFVAAMDGRDLWRTSQFAARREELPEPADSVRTALGDGIPFEVIDTKEWAGHHAVAERFRDRRVLIAGDAAHLLWPSGGFGMNTGMGDAVDLGWKLAATLQGWGGPGLLESYDLERRPIGERNVSGASEIRATDDQMALSDALDDDTEEGARLRQRLGRFIANSPRGEEFRTRLPGLELGYSYDGSPLCVPDGSKPVPNSPTTYAPSARPGGRAPHAWLSGDRSILDLFGPGFTLLRLGGHARDTKALEIAARHRRLPLEVVDLDQPEITDLYERRLVLVRPDGHVAWRADDLPPDPQALLDRIAGF